MGSPLYIRVNGVNISHIKLRRKMLDGLPVGNWEIVIDVPATETLPALGTFALDENDEFPFVIEVKDTSIPASVRRSLPGKGWKIVSTADLLTLLTPSIEAVTEN